MRTRFGDICRRIDTDCLPFERAPAISSLPLVHQGASGLSSFDSRTAIDFGSALARLRRGQPYLPLGAQRSPGAPGRGQGPRRALPEGFCHISWTWRPTATNDTSDHGGKPVSRFLLSGRSRHSYKVVCAASEAGTALCGVTVMSRSENVSVTAGGALGYIDCSASSA